MKNLNFLLIVICSLFYLPAHIESFEGARPEEGKPHEGPSSPSTKGSSKPSEGAIKAEESKGDTAFDPKTAETSRPTTNPWETGSKSISKTVQGNKASTGDPLSQSTNLQETDLTEPSEPSQVGEDSVTAGPKELNEFERADQKAKEDEETNADQKTENDENIQSEYKKGTSTTDAIKETFTKIIESFSKLLDSFSESITRTWEQDTTLTKEERDALKENMNTAKNEFKKLQDKFDALGDNPTEEQKEEIQKSIKAIKDNLSSIVMRTDKDSTIYKDLTKALDDLDPNTAQEIKDSAAEKREIIAKARENVDYYNNKQWKADFAEANYSAASQPGWAQGRENLNKAEQKNNKAIQDYIGDDKIKADTYNKMSSRQIKRLTKKS